MVAAVVMGLAYVGVVVFLIVWIGDKTSGDFDDFSKYWGLFGTLVGVVTGAIPSFFFKAQADKADERARDASKRAETYARFVDPGKEQDLRAVLPS